MKLTTIRVFAVVFAFALLVAACGSGSTSDEAATDPVAKTTTTVVAANSDTDEADPETVDGRVVEVTMTELFFTPDQVTVSAGETVVFQVTNEGVIEHEFRLSNEHRIEEHLASGHADHEDADMDMDDMDDADNEGGHHGDADIVMLLGPGESGEVAVTFSEDTTLFTEVACLIPGHYEAGMKADIQYD